MEQSITETAGKLYRKSQLRVILQTCIGSGCQLNHSETVHLMNNAGKDVLGSLVANCFAHRMEKFNG